MSGEKTTNMGDRIKFVPVDLVAVLATVGLTGVVVYLPVVNESLLRPVIGLCFVLLVPGYALVSALFPETGPESESPQTDRENSVSDPPGDSAAAEPSKWATYGRRIDSAERVVLSFGLSIAIVPLIALAVTVLPLEFTSIVVFVALALFIVGCTIIAGVRRRKLPESDRFRIQYRNWTTGQTDSGSGADAGVSTVLSVGLVVAALLTVGVLGFATVSPADGEQFTEFYLLTEQDDGELVAAEYPETLSPDDPEHVHIGLENKEHDTVDYTVVVQLQQITDTENGATAVERVELDRMSTTLAPGETWLNESALTTPEGMSSEDRRLAVLLYDGDAPATPTRENADESLHMWVDVEGEASEEPSGEA